MSISVHGLSAVIAAITHAGPSGIVSLASHSFPIDWRWAENRRKHFPRSRQILEEEKNPLRKANSGDAGSPASVPGLIVRRPPAMPPGHAAGRIRQLANRFRFRKPDRLAAVVDRGFGKFRRDPHRFVEVLDSVTRGDADPQMAAASGIADR